MFMSWALPKSMRLQILTNAKRKKLPQIEMVRDCEIARNKALMTCAFLDIPCLLSHLFVAVVSNRLNLKFPLANNKGKVHKVMSCLGRNMDDALQTLQQSHEIYNLMWPFLTKNVCQY